MLIFSKPPGICNSDMGTKTLNKQSDWQTAESAVWTEGSY